MTTQENLVPTRLSKSRLKISSLRSKYGAFSVKVISAIGDQGLFAGSNFITTLLLGRWMIKEELGAVVVALTWFQLIQTFYESLVVAPMSYYGADKYQNRFQRYLGYIFTGHVLVSVTIAAIFGIIALLVNEFNSALLGQAMAGVAVSTVFLLARGLIRQPFYVLSKPQLSAIGGAIYLVVNIVSTVILYQSNLLNPFTALVGMGLASFITVIVQVIMLKPQYRGNYEDITPKSVMADHWEYGKWAISAQSISWLSTNFGILLIPLVTGFSSSATIRATTILILPVIMMNTALVSLLTPIFVRTYKSEGARGLDKRVRNTRLMVMAVTGVYFIVLSIFGKQLVHILYDGNYDEEVSSLYMVALAAMPFITTVSRIFDAGLMSMGKIKLSFKSKIVPTTLTVILDLILVVPFGILGIAIESLITASLTQYNVYKYYRSKINEDIAAADEASSKQPGTPLEGQATPV